MREPSTGRAGRKTGAGRVAGWTAAGGLVVGLEAALTTRAIETRGERIVKRLDCREWGCWLVE